MAFSGFGAITNAAESDAADAAGADYLEPIVVGNVVVPDGDGWRLGEGFGDGRYPSFAQFVPGYLRILDPAEGAGAFERYLEAVVPLIGSVAEPGAKIVFGSGRARTAPDGMPRDEALRRFADALRLARDAAAASGLRVMLEPLNRDETDVVNSIEEGARLLEEHGIDGVRIVVDLFHLQHAGESLAGLERHAALIGHAHVCDAGRAPLGAGGWPWRDYLDALADAGYTDSVSLECSWSNDVGGEVAGSIRLLRDHAGV